MGKTPTPMHHLREWLRGSSNGGHWPDSGTEWEDLDDRIHRAGHAVHWLEQRRPRRRRRLERPGGVPKWELPWSLGPFRILRELGRGGFGVVLLVRKGDGPPLALKLPRPEFLIEDEFLEQFLLEGRVVEMLDHPNLVRVMEAGTIGPLYYISYEYYPGLTLAEWVELLGRPLEPDEAVAIIAAIGSGLQHAHDRGVLHRDIAPHNIILVPADTPEAEGGLGRAGETGFVPKLADFGLARIMGEHQGDAFIPMAGRLSYLAPEEIDPAFGDTGPAVDVYALGAVLYELLVGTPPFPATPRDQALRRIVAEPPPAPRQLRTDVPEPLEAVCLRCLAKRPDERFPSVDAFLAELGQPDDPEAGDSW